MVYALRRSQARAQPAGKYWKMKMVAAGITNKVPMQRQWAPPVGVSGHEGLTTEEFRRRCLEEGKEGPCRMTGTCGDQARVMLWQGPAVVGTGRLARRVAAAPEASWAPPAGVPSLRGESKEEFLQGCDSWYRRDEGQSVQSVPCRVIEPSCQGGQNALVRFWCKEKLVPWAKLTWSKPK